MGFKHKWSNANKPPALTEAEAKQVKGPKPVPNATTWVMRGLGGDLEAVKVVDMTSTHLHGWIRYFRQKYRGEGGVVGPESTDDQVDAAIMLTMVTASAIYAEAEKRGVYVPPKPKLPMEPDPRVTKPQPATTVEQPRGYRRITLGEDE